MKMVTDGFITLVADIGWFILIILQVTAAGLLITIIREQVRGQTQAE